jgi:hypothetical protein
MYCPNPECIDFVQDGIHGEYLDTVSVCPKCGSTLVSELPRASRHILPMPEEAIDHPASGAQEESDELPPPPAGLLVAVVAFDYPDETEPAVALLTANGIVVYQFLDDGRDFADQQGYPVCTRLLVPQSQAGLAATLLAEASQGG